MSVLCDDVLLEVLTFIHPLSWIPEFQRLINVREKWINLPSYVTSKFSYKMYDDVDINNYFHNMRKTKGSQYKQGILNLLKAKQANPHMAQLVDKYYTYDMEAMLRLLDPSIFGTFRTNLAPVLKDIKRRYVTPTHTNEGCLCCERALPYWYAMFGSQAPATIRKQVGKREFKTWAKQTKNMFQLGCCSELCYLALFRTQVVPNEGDKMPVCRHCSSCRTPMDVFQTFMTNGKSLYCAGDDRECIECQVYYAY